MRLERLVAPIVVSLLLAAAIVAAQETPSPGIHTKQKVKIAERRLSDKSKLDPEVQALVDIYLFEEDARFCLVQGQRILDGS